MALKPIFEDGGRLATRIISQHEQKAGFKARGGGKGVDFPSFSHYFFSLTPIRVRVEQCGHSIVSALPPFPNGRFDHITGALAVSILDADRETGSTMDKEFPHMINERLLVVTFDHNPKSFPRLPRWIGRARSAGPRHRPPPCISRRSCRRYGCLRPCPCGWLGFRNPHPFPPA